MPVQPKNSAYLYNVHSFLIMKRLLFIIALLFSIQSFSQPINHWETVIDQGDFWKYLVPGFEPSPMWNTLGFNDSFWNVGNSGFGYGDGDDSTIIANTISLYLRKQFNIIDTSVIQEAKLHMDYDDGFVAYLNGVEIARYNMTGTPPPFDQVSDSEHEALLYQGLIPEEYVISKATLSALLNQGNNVLAIQ